jgi:membrane protein implicated in regulation of membrane protease activity
MRRRQVLLVLVGMMLGFFVLGLVPSLRVLWDVSLLAFAATAGYLALLIHFHRRAVERDVKVVVMQDRRTELRGAVTAPPRTPTWHISVEDEGWADYEPVDDAFSGDYDNIVAGGR